MLASEPCTRILHAFRWWAQCPALLTSMRVGVIYGDRVDASDLMVTGVRRGSDGSFLEDARKAAQRANILIAL